MLSGERTPELYLGAAREVALASPQLYAVDTPRRFTLPSTLPRHRFALDGVWTIGEEQATAEPGSLLELRFVADDVYLVLVPSGPGAAVSLFLDGQAVTEVSAGVDVHAGKVQISEARLYHLIDLHGAPGENPCEHTIRLVFEGSQSSVFAFTFG